MDDGKCCCGHDIDPETGACLIMDANQVIHQVSSMLGRCSCHDFKLQDIERSWLDSVARERVQIE